MVINNHVVDCMTDRLRELFAGSSRSSGTPEFKHVSVSLKKKKKTTKNASSESKEPERADISRSDGDGLGMQLPAERLSSKIVSNSDKDERTVFVGNLPLTVTKKNIKKLFMQCGQVESLRFRSMAIAPGRLPVGVARKVHCQLTGSCVNCYVVFESKQAVDRSLELNGTDMGGRHLRVDRVTHTIDHAHSVFVGNVPFSADEEQLRTLFQRCGQVKGVRMVRDNTTGAGKGFAYVLFSDTSGVLFACQQSGHIELDGRKLRISKCKPRAGKPFVGTQALARSKVKNKRQKGIKRRGQ